MTYSVWHKKIKDFLSFRVKNYSLTDCELDMIMTTVYTEIMTDTYLAYVGQLVFPNEVDDKVYKLDEPNILYDFYPMCYEDSMKDEVVDIACEDATSLNYYFDEVFRTQYRLNDYIHKEMFSWSSIEGRPVVFWWKCTPEINKCEHWIYDAIYNAMTQGVLYYVQDTLITQIDSSVANLSYQRYFNEKKKILSRYPTRHSFETSKLIYNYKYNITDLSELSHDCSDALYDCSTLEYEDPCYPINPCEPLEPLDPCVPSYPSDPGNPGDPNPDPECNEFIVIDGQNFLTFHGNQYYVSGVHGDCGEDDNNPGNPPQEPELEYGLICDGVCPDCVDFNVLKEDRTGFELFLPSGADGYNVGPTHNQCKPEEELPGDIIWGNDCSDTNGDCPDCLWFNVFDPVAEEMETYTTTSGEYNVGSAHASCAPDLNPEDPDDLPWGFNATITIADDSTGWLGFDAKNGTYGVGMQYSINGVAFQSVPSGGSKSYNYAMQVSNGQTVELRSDDKVDYFAFTGYITYEGNGHSAHSAKDIVISNGAHLVRAKLGSQHKLEYIAIEGKNSLVSIRSLVSNNPRLLYVGALYTEYVTESSYAFAEGCPELICLAEIDTSHIAGTIDKQYMFRNSENVISPNVDEQAALMSSSGSVYVNSELCGPNMPLPKTDGFRVIQPNGVGYDDFFVSGDAFITQ